MGIYSWCANKLKAVSDGVSTAYSTTKAILTFPYTFLTSQSTTEWLSHAWQGFAMAMNPVHLYKVLGQSPTAKAWRLGFYNVMARLGPYLLFRALARPAIRYAVRYAVSENPVVETVAVNAVETAVGAAVLASNRKGARAANVASANNANAAGKSAQGSLLETVAVKTIEVGATAYYFAPNRVKGGVNSALDTLSVSKASAAETAPKKSDDQPAQPANNAAATNPLITGGEDGAQAHVAGNAKAMVHYMGASFAIRMLASYLTAGELLMLPVQAILDGQWVTGATLAEAGHSEEDTINIQRENNAYNLGVGLCLMMTQKFWQVVIAHLTGDKGSIVNDLIASEAGPLFLFSPAFWQTVVDHVTGTQNYFVDEALASMLTMHFIMASNLSRETPLPGKVPPAPKPGEKAKARGFDFFKVPRAMTDVAVAQAVEWAGETFGGPVEGDWFQEMKKDIANKFELPPVKALCWLLVDQSLQDWDEAAMRPSTQMFLALYGDTLLAGIRYIKEERAKGAYQTIDSASQWVNKKEKGDTIFTKIAKSTVDVLISAVASEDDRKTLGILMQPELAAPLDEWEQYILHYTNYAKAANGGDVQVVGNYGEAGAPKINRAPGFYHLNDPAHDTDKPDVKREQEERIVRQVVNAIHEAPQKVEAELQQRAEPARRPPPPANAPEQVSARRAKPGFFASVVSEDSIPGSKHGMSASTQAAVRGLARQGSGANQ